MFDRREHRVGRAETYTFVAALEPAHARGSHHGSEIRVFARSF
jgi:hypothetical protein